MYPPLTNGPGKVFYLRGLSYVSIGAYYYTWRANIEKAYPPAKSRAARLLTNIW